MKHLIVPTDFSDNAFKAASFAISLAIECQANILVIHAYYPFKSGFQPEKVNLQDAVRSKEEAEKEMKNFIEKLTVPDIKIHLDAVCHQGNLLQIINNLGAQMENPVVVMGTTGATGLKYKLIGSNTLYIAKHSLFPLIVVPDGTENFLIKKIALFTDYNADDQKTLDGLVSLFGTSGIRYKLVHILRSDSPAKKEHFAKLEAWLQELAMNSSIENLSGELVEGKTEISMVEEIAGRNDIHLLALTMTEHNFWDRIFEKSFAKLVILQAKTPVFIQSVVKK